MKEIPLTQGLVALVDDADFEAVNAFKWYAHKVGQRVYAKRKVGPKSICLHRFLMPETSRIRHLNEDGLDNQRHNLLSRTAYQSSQMSMKRVPLTKFCRDCKTDKLASDFSRYNNSRDGLQYQCKECCRIRWASRAITHCIKNRAGHIKRKYGLTYPEYQAMLERQQSKCSICNRIFETTGRKKTWKTPCVDHCHDSGKVRSLLCHSCNCLLGNCLEDPKILLRAIQYLSKHKTEKQQKKDKPK